MLRVFVRRSSDVRYFSDDAALELDGVRDGDAGWWLRGEGPTTDDRHVASVFSTTPRSSVVGYDLVVAAPRPISILLAIDPTEAPAVVAAHRASVRASIDYLERRALVVRDRRHGEDRDVPARWAAIVGFTHGVNRHGEPHLHDHVLVGARPAGASSVLDSRALYAHLDAADAIYRTSLRHALAQRSAWTAWRSHDDGYRALWPGHHRTRGEKLTWTRDDAVSSWDRDLRDFSPNGSVPVPPRDPNSLDEHAFAGAFEGRSVVARRHVVASWADAAVFGHEPTSLERAVDATYPSLGTGLGVRETSISVREARMTRQVRERGPRPIDSRDLEAWRHRERGERSRSERSR